MEADDKAASEEIEEEKYELEESKLDLTTENAGKKSRKTKKGGKYSKSSKGSRKSDDWIDNSETNREKRLKAHLEKAEIKRIS